MKNPTTAIVVLLFLTTISASLPAASDASAVQQMQQRRLFEPSESELRKESSGNVYIYDGLTDKTVQRALNEEFDRLGSMMFIRTVHTDDSGKPKRDSGTGEILQDHDCD